MTMLCALGLAGCARVAPHSLAVPPHPTSLAPLIVILHGAGDTSENYLETWRSEAERRGLLILAPAMKNLDFETLDRLIQRTIRRYDGDPEKVVLAGVSAGALKAREFLLKHPERWKAAVFIAGPEDSGWIEEVGEGALPPILFVHGEKDPQFDVLGVSEQVERLRQKGIQVEFLRDPDAGHEHRPEWNSHIFDWIEKKG